jgi:hypothetical protein
MTSSRQFRTQVQGASLINGEFFTVEAEGKASPEDGTAHVDWDLSSLPKGFAVHLMVACTNSGMSQAFALERKGGSNFLSLAGGNYRLYRVFDYGRYGSYDFDYEIRTSGDLMTSRGFSRGHLGLPKIVDARMSLVEVIAPAGPKRMYSTMKTAVIAEGGEEIPVSVTGYYSPLVDDGESRHSRDPGRRGKDWTQGAAPQIRRSLVERVEGRGTLSLRYTTVIETIPEPDLPQTGARRRRSKQ